MIPYDKITKKELYAMAVQKEIAELERQLVPYDFTPATMYHAHMGGWINQENKHLLIKGSDPFIPDLKAFKDNYTNNNGYSAAADMWREELIDINKRLKILKEETK